MAGSIPILPAAPAAVDVQHWLRPGTLNLPVQPPLSLYVHVPWCVRKCPYCDFNSHEFAAEGAHHTLPAALEARYLDALRADLEASLALVWGRPVISVFIGGGTPSLLSARGVERLLSDLRALLPLAADAEITLEANPGTVESGKFAEFRAAGITRLSIGVQSFDDTRLQALGRIHGRPEAVLAAELAQRHFATFNLDLMYALPGQTLGALQDDVATALALAPPHLSLYQLTIEPNTAFAHAPPVLPDDDDAAAMHDWLVERTADAGLARYEISAFARPGHQCRHNLNYWTFGDYLGIGAGAHGKLSFPHRVLRQLRARGPDSYLQRATRGEFVAGQHEVARADLPFEFMLNALRLTAGVPAALFAERTGLPPGVIESARRQAEARGLLQRSDERLVATARGLLFLSDLQAMFLPKVRDVGA